MIDWQDLLTALALLLILEGILPFLSPNALRRAMLLLSQMNDRQVRVAGISSMVVGVIVLYLVN